MGPLAPLAGIPSLPWDVADLVKITDEYETAREWELARASWNGHRVSYTLRAIYYFLLAILGVAYALLTISHGGHVATSTFAIILLVFGASLNYLIRARRGSVTKPPSN